MPKRLVDLVEQVVQITLYNISDGTCSSEKGQLVKNIVHLPP